MEDSCCLSALLMAIFFARVTGQVCDTPSPSLDTSSNGVGGVLVVSCTVGSGSVGWRSDIFVTNPVVVNIVLNPPAVLSIPLLPSITGVTATESRVGDSSCLKSTITFTGDVAMLNGTNITCINGNDGTEASGTIRVASTPESVVVMATISNQSLLPSCTVQWSEPFNGGDNITGYYITVTGGGSVQQVMVSSTDTSYTTAPICPGNYTFTVVAENRVGNSSSSNTNTCGITSNVKNPSITQVCIQKSNIMYTLTLNWSMTTPSNVYPPVLNFTVFYNNNSLTVSSDRHSTMFSIEPNQNYSLSVTANIFMCGLTTTSSAVTTLSEGLVRIGSCEPSCYDVDSSGSLVRATLLPTVTCAPTRPVSQYSSSSTNLRASSFPIPNNDLALALGVSLPLTFLLTAIISSLLASLITYLCLTRGRKQTYSPPVQKPSSTAPVPEYEPVFSPSTSGDLEMKSNEAYGHVTTTSSHVTYETINPSN